MNNDRVMITLKQAILTTLVGFFLIGWSTNIGHLIHSIVTPQNEITFQYISLLLIPFGVVI